jgi:hypothetical protein
VSQPSIGRIVRYKLSDDDALSININRQESQSLGNVAWPGDVYPAMVVRTWDTSVQLQVFLDGPDTYWATSVLEGDGERQWSWPPRV